MILNVITSGLKRFGTGGGVDVPRFVWSGKSGGGPAFQNKNQFGML